MSTPAPLMIALVVEAKTPSLVSIAKLVDALNVQANEHLAPAWGLGPVEVVRSGHAIPPGHWALVLLDDADQADALGYHDVTADGLPIGKVFVRTTLADGQKVSVTASHELAEMLVDPYCNTAAQADDGTFYAFESADAVEDREYEIGGVAVSDFVYPAWFQPERAGAKLSHLDSVSKPFTLTRGGYISVYKVGPHGGGWSQEFGSHEARTAFNPRRKLRAMRRSGVRVAARVGALYRAYQAISRADDGAGRTD